MRQILVVSWRLLLFLSVPTFIQFSNLNSTITQCTSFFGYAQCSILIYNFPLHVLWTVLNLVVLFFRKIQINMVVPLTLMIIVTLRHVYFAMYPRKNDDTTKYLKVLQSITYYPRSIIKSHTCVHVLVSNLLSLLKTAKSTRT